MRDLFAASLRYGGGSREQGKKKKKNYSCLSISHSILPCLPHTYTDTVHIRFLIKSFKVRKLKNVL